MGGEWNFVLLGDPTTIDVKRYQQELLKISQKYRYDPKLFENAKWFNPTKNQTEPVDNIFAKFMYKCERHESNWHRKQPWSDASNNAWWVLYWDPTKFQKGYNSWGDVYARCSPRDFIYKSVTMQRHLAINFPEHFQVYLGDDVDGYGDCELYWGVKPKHLDNSDEDSDNDDNEASTSANEWFLESI